MEREAATRGLVLEMVAQDGVDAAFDRLERLPDEPPYTAYKQAALRSAVGLVARADPERAARVVEAHRGERAHDMMVRRLAVNWVTQDGVAAMAWLQRLPEGDHRSRVTREAFRRWLMRDRPAAMKWMEERDDYGQLASLTDMYASALARRDPERAASWAEALEEESARREAMLDLGQIWYADDPEAASTWLRRVGLYDEVKQRTTGRPGPRGGQAAGQPPRRARALQ
jgi:hypothetical protein